jgi:hypothetical protein
LSSTRTSVHMVDGDASLGHVVSDDGRRETPKPRIMLLYTGKSYTLFNVVVPGWVPVDFHPSPDLNEHSTRVRSTCTEPSSAPTGRPHGDLDQARSRFPRSRIPATPMSKVLPHPGTPGRVFGKAVRVRSDRRSYPPPSHLDRGRVDGRGATQLPDMVPR